MNESHANACWRLLAGLEDWHVPLTPNTTDSTQPSTSFIPERAAEALEALSKGGAMEHDEQYYCMQARFSALSLQPEVALNLACACAADTRAIVRLRTYLPALAAFSHQGMSRSLIAGKYVHDHSIGEQLCANNQRQLSFSPDMLARVSLKHALEAIPTLR
jgi:hypothetical protein